MKKLSLTLICMFFSIFAFADKSEAFGTWITEKSDSGNQIIVEIYEKNNKVYGRINKLTDRFNEQGELRKDVNNPDTSKRERTLEGIDFVSGFTYNDGNSTYESGTIYDPSSGKTYSCYMVLQSDGKLKVRGHIKGLSFIGKTQYWSRVN